MNRAKEEAKNLAVEVLFRDARDLSDLSMFHSCGEETEAGGRSRRDESRWHGQPTLRLPERGQGFVLLHQVQTALDATHHTRFVLSFILSKPRFAHLPESASRFLVLFLFEIMAEGYIHGSKYEKPRELVVLL